MISHAGLGPFARIALAIPVRELFDYRVPEAIHDRVVPGMRVRVPFGRGSRIGYCIERAERSKHPEHKDVAAALDDAPILNAELLRLVRWTADYYLASIGEVIESAIPRRVREQGKPKPVLWARIADAKLPLEEDPPPSKPARGGGAAAAARQSILDILGARGPLPVDELTRELNGEPNDTVKKSSRGRSSIRTLANRGGIVLYKAPPPHAPDFMHETDFAGELDGAGAPPLAKTAAAPLALTSEQESAIAAIRDAALAPRYETFLLHGVTGSGKTEVYLRAIECVVRAGRGALVLLPEIALTPQTVQRFRERFARVAVLHSLLPPAERSRAFRSLMSGETRVAVGARSAIFAPIRDLGIIIVDECHESSYKQESAPRYHATDLATLRASQLAIPCVLGSATPSFEQLGNAERGRFTLLPLPHRVTGHPLAFIEIIDRRPEWEIGRPPPGLLSPRLRMVLTETLKKGEQAILLLNRRGFARHLHCPSCGFTLRCDACEVCLTFHKREGHSLCHYCGAAAAVPARCPECGFAGIRRSVPGTEKIEESLQKLYPGVSMARLDRDTASSRDRLEAILKRFREGGAQVLIGTQMVAKGHDVPNVTLVGVIDADVALAFPDFRAAEKTFQLLCQVAGRAGRGERPGRVIVQTRHPEHYAIEAARRQNPQYIFDIEKSSRKLLGYPPYGHLVRVLIEDPREERAIACARAILEILRSARAPSVTILGPAPAPMQKLRGRYRHHLLLKGKNRGELRGMAERISGFRPPQSTTRVTIDVDPQALM